MHWFHAIEVNLWKPVIFGTMVQSISQSIYQWYFGILNWEVIKRKTKSQSLTKISFCSDKQFFGKHHGLSLRDSLKQPTVHMGYAVNLKRQYIAYILKAFKMEKCLLVKMPSWCTKRFLKNIHIFTDYIIAATTLLGLCYEHKFHAEKLNLFLLLNSMNISIRVL